MRRRALKPSHIITVTLVTVLLGFMVLVESLFAAPNQNINYQGKLTDDTGATVADGEYSIRFKLYTAPTGGGEIWTESASTTITSGLFSYMLGSTSPLTSINFNQTLYLGVEIGGTGATPTWDGEMSPRKVLGTVPAAFEARQLDGLGTTSFLRADTPNATGSITNFAFDSATGTSLALGTSTYRGLFTLAGNFFVGTSSAATLFASTAGDFVGIGATSQLGTEALRVAGDIALGNNTIGNDGDGYGLTFGDSGASFENLSGAQLAYNFRNTSTADDSGSRIVFESGTSIEMADIESTVDGNTQNSRLVFRVRGSNSLNEAARFTSQGYFGIGSSTPNSKLTVAGDTHLGGNLRATGTVRFDTLTSGALITDANGNVSAVATTTWDTNTTGPTLVVAASDALDTTRADYVADGTDDEATIQTAINALPASGGTVMLSEGTFNVGTTTYTTSVITLDSNVRLIGQGSSTVLRLNDGSGNNIAILYATGKSFVTIKDLNLQGNRANNTNDNQNGITFTNTSSSTIDGVIANDFQDYGVYLSGSYSNRISNSTTNDNEDVGFYLTSSSNNNLLSNNVANNNSIHGFLLSSSNNTFTNNVANNNSSHGFFLLSSANNNLLSNNLANNNSSDGFYLVASSNNNLLSSNRIEDSGSHGIHIDDSTNNTIEGNYLVNNGDSATEYAIFVNDTSPDTSIVGNTLIGDNSAPLIFIEQAGSARTTIANNIYENANRDDSNFITDNGTGTRYDDYNRTTLTTTANVGYNLFNITGTSSVALASLSQYGTGDILNLFDGDTEAFTVLDGGNVGIGSSTPSSKLTVAGNTHLGGSLRATGTVRFDALTSGALITDANGNVSAVATTTWDTDTNYFTQTGSTTYLTNLQDSLSVGSSTAYGRLSVSNRNLTSGAWSLVGSTTLGAFAGTPAITTLSPNRVAYIDTTNDQLRTYEFNGSSWNQIGASLSVSIISGAALTTLSENRIAFIENVGDNLRVYEFDGTTWSQIGTDTNITSGGTYQSLTTLSPNRVAFYDATDDLLITYEFNGSGWNQVGSSFDTSYSLGTGITGLTTLSPNRVTISGNGSDTIDVYEFNGSAWSQVGTSFSVPDVGGVWLTTLSPNRIVFIDSSDYDLRVYEFNGTTWSQVGVDLNISGIGGASMTTLSPNRVVFIDNNFDSLRTYQFSEPTMWVGNEEEYPYFTISDNGSTLINNLLVNQGLTVRAAATGTNAINGTTTPALWVDGRSVFGDQLTANRGIFLASTTALVTTSNTLYNRGGTLYFNGSEVGGSSSLFTDAGSLTYLTATNDLFAIGTTSALNSSLFTVSTSSANTALTVAQYGAGDILNLYNGNVAALTVDTDGNMLLGTTTSRGLLTVDGDLYVGTSSTPTLFVDTSAQMIGINSNAPSTALRVGGEAGNYLTGGLSFGDGTDGIYQSASNVLAMRYDGSDRIFFDSSGDIYSTTGHGYRIDSSANVTFAPNDNSLNSGLGNVSSISDAALGLFSNDNLALVVDNDTVSISTTTSRGLLTVDGDLYVGSDATPALFVNDTTNYVGIGTSTPLRALSVNSTNGVVSELTSSNASGVLLDVYSSAASSSGIRFRGSTGWTVGNDGTTNNFVIANGLAHVGNAPNKHFVVGTNGRVGIGSTTPTSLLSVRGAGFSGTNKIFGFDQYFTSANSVENAVQYGARSYIDIDSNTATTTFVGSMSRIEDNTSFGNTIRGLEVQADRGVNTLGENTALSGFARTFGVRGTTRGDAGGLFEPAGGFFATEGTTQGNAIRGYSDSITSAALLSLFQASSTFTGTGLRMSFGNGGTGDFSSTSSKFLDFQNAGNSYFTVTAYGTTTIGRNVEDVNAKMAGLQIGNGGICVDSDGACTATTSGRITANEYGTAASDLAEMYFSSEALLPGEVVYLKGGLSIGRATNDTADRVLGVVSTKPGLTLGFDDRSTTPGEKGFPLALTGRVPVRLSTENGPIAKGDELMLSSLPGVAMKATGTGQVIGIALDDYTGELAYSETFLNQFAEDLIEPVYAPVKDITDPRIDDGCYYGGGGALGEEDCTPIVAEDTGTIVAEADRIARLEAEHEAFAEMQDEAADIMTLDNGERVAVGQVVMFVDRYYRYVTPETEQSLAGFMRATSTVIGHDGVDTVQQSIFERMADLVSRFVDGVLSVLELKADRVEVAEELCVDDVCITANDLRTLLEASNNQGQVIQVIPATTTVTTISEEPTNTADIDTIVDTIDNSKSINSTSDTSDSNNGGLSDPATSTSSSTENNIDVEPDIADDVASSTPVETNFGDDVEDSEPAVAAEPVEQSEEDIVEEPVTETPAEESVSEESEEDAPVAQTDSEIDTVESEPAPEVAPETPTPEEPAV